MRKGLTLIELLIVVGVIVIIASVTVGILNSKGCSSEYWNTQKTAVYRCVKAYPYTEGNGETITTSKRVDVQEIHASGAEIGSVQTFECDDSWQAGISNSATLYAQFEAGNYYEITTIGTRREGWYNYFPLVKSVRKVER